MTIEEARDYAKGCHIPQKRIDALIAELHPDERGNLSLEESMEAIKAIRIAANNMDGIRTMLKAGKRARRSAVMDYRAGYDFIINLQNQLAAQHHDAEVGCLDYKVVKALAATYELQDYLAGRIAQGVASGEIDPDEEE